MLKKAALLPIRPVHHKAPAWARVSAPPVREAGSEDSARSGKNRGRREGRETERERETDPMSVSVFVGCLRLWAVPLKKVRTLPDGKFWEDEDARSLLRPVNK